jgi:hypothetical protein
MSPLSISEDHIIVVLAFFAHSGEVSFLVL